VERNIAWVHAFCVGIAYPAYGALYVLGPGLRHTWTRWEPWDLAVLGAVALPAAIGLLAGVWLTAMRRGEPEGAVLAISSFAAFLILIISLLSLAGGICV
jgi:hypothetical protein